MEIRDVELCYHCRPSFIAFVFLVLAGCGFYSRTYEVAIRMPEVNTPNFPALPADTSEPETGNRFWDVSWLDMDGTISGRRIENGHTIVLNLPKEQPAVVCAVPLIPGVFPPFRYRPAGCLRPAEMPVASELQLTWEDGFSSFFMLELARSGVSPDRINIRRFQDAVALRGGGSPWSLDLRRLVSDFVSGDIWIYSFVIPPKYPVVIPLPPGRWYSEYPPEFPLISLSGSWSGELPEGLHRFLEVPGGACVSVSVSDRGEVGLIREY